MDKKLEDIFLRIQWILERKVMICYFPVMWQGSPKYRFYFRDLDSGYIHNLTVNNNGSIKYKLWDSFPIGLDDMADQAEEYLKTKNKTLDTQAPTA